MAYRGAAESKLAITKSAILHSDRGICGVCTNKPAQTAAPILHV